MEDAKIENPDISISTDGEIAVSEVKTTEKPTPKPAKKKSPADKGGFWWGTGRRKSSVARVRIKPGTGKLSVNKKELKDYFSGEKDRKAVIAPLKAVDAERSFDVFVNVKG
ncbi:MAG: 30S ribosomal protein S9, partial [Planctomycetota bacterium]